MIQLQMQILSGRKTFSWTMWFWPEKPFSRAIKTPIFAVQKTRKGRHFIDALYLRPVL